MDMLGLYVSYASYHHFNDTFHITFRLHVNELTLLSGGGRVSAEDCKARHQFLRPLQLKNQVFFFQPFSWQQNKMFLVRGQSNFQLCLWRQTQVIQNMISLDPNQVVLCLNPTRPLAQCCHNLKMKPEHKER